MLLLVQPRMNARRLDRCLLVIFFAGACTSARPGEEPRSGARLDLVLAHGRLELAGADPTLRWALPSQAPHTETDLTWSFSDASGGVIATGEIADPRLVRYEPLPDERVADTLRAGAGMITVEVPDVTGTLAVRDAAGSVIGEFGFEPLHGVAFAAGRGDGKSDIDFTSDVIGAPVLVAGDGDPDHHLNVLVVPEGYTASELARFHDDARGMISTLLASDGYRDHRPQLNVWYQDIKSAESGISDPAIHTTKKTAFDITFGDGQSLPRRCLMPSASWKTVSASNMSRLGDTTHADTVIVLANVAEVGGCADFGGRFTVLSNHAASNPGATLAHELGHSLFGLGDEYVEAGRQCAVGYPNLSEHLDQLPWRDLIAATTPIPTPSTQSGHPVGAYQGGGFCAQGVYRPQPTCKMRSLDVEFCAVCRRELERRFARRAASVSRATITNRTGAELWVVCDGRFGTPRCTGWTKLAPDASAEMALSDGRFILSSSTVMWPTPAFDAPSAQFSIYANPADPFTMQGETTPDGGVVDTAAGTCTLANVVINEVQTAGTSAADEFIELFNPCGAAIDLAGARLVYRSGAAAVDSAVLATLSGTISAGGYYVVASTQFAGTAQIRYTSGISASRGGVGLRDASDNLLDAVAWGAADNGFVETEPAAAPPASSSIARTPNGVDTQNNAHDLTVTTPTPGAMN